VLEDYVVVFQWLLVAIGAALLLGTGAALVAYRRTGSFPGQPAGRTPSVRTAVAKCVVGAVLILVAGASLVVRL
jgi:hypothetical protein